MKAGLEAHFVEQYHQIYQLAFDLQPPVEGYENAAKAEAGTAAAAAAAATAARAYFAR